MYLTYLTYLTKAQQHKFANQLRGLAVTMISTLRHTEPAPPDSTAARPRLPEPAGPPRPRSDHPKAGFYRRPPHSEGGSDQPAAANSSRYL
jgi:hypothetical protein